MSSPDLYCPTCGAANSSDKTLCFACGKDLAQAASEDEQTTALLNNRYRILAQVGQGGFAQVYRAEDTQRGRIVAIKAISLKALSPQQMIDATDTYNREIRFGTTLKHPSLPKIYDYFTGQEHWYIVADFIEGQTLEEYMQSRPAQRLPIWEVLEIGVQVCDVLSYLHSRQPPVIFRDIKPDNIMRTSSGRIYLIDFGIARQLRPGLRRDTQALGSPGYAAPEQYGKAQTTERSDIYSLGATLQALLTGKNPLDEDNEDDDEQQVTLPPDLSTLLSQMLESDPQKRPANITIVKQQLEQIAQHNGIVLQNTKNITTQSRIWQSTAPPAPPPTPAIAPLPSTPRFLLWKKALMIGLLVFVVGGVSSISLSPLLQSAFSRHPISYAARLPLPANQQVFTYAVSNAAGIDTLDPATASSPLSLQAVSMLYTGLVSLNDKMEVQPQLAASWQQSEDGLSWTFYLRPNLRFSDGIPLTSQDVAYSLDRALDPAINSATAPYDLHYIQGADERASRKIPTLIGSSILTPDASTIIIKTSTRTAFFPYTLTGPWAFVVEKSLIDKYGSLFVNHLDEGGSSGPFKFSRYIAHERLELVPNPNYYGARPRLTKVTFLMYNDSQIAYNAYLVYQATMVVVPITRIIESKNRSDFHQAPQLRTTYYAMNYLVKPFDNIKIRQAFALALNKEVFAHTLWRDTVLATNHIIPQGEDGYNPSLTGPDGSSSLSGDFDRARQLLQEGMQEEGIKSIEQFPPVTLSYATNGSPQVEDEVAAVQQMWQNILNVNVRLQALSFVDLVNKENGNVNNAHGLQLWRTDWLADYPDPQDWTTLQFGRGSFFNATNYGQNGSSDAAEQQRTQLLLQHADSLPDESERMATYRQAEQQLVNDVAILPLYQYQENYLLRTSVRGYVVNAMNIVPPDDWASIYLME